MKPIGWVLLLALSATSAGADGAVRYRVHADLIAMPTREGGPSRCTRTLPKTGDIVTLTWRSDRARLDRPDRSVILRPDEERLYFLFHETKTYAWVKYPVPYKKYRTQLENSFGTEMLQYQLESLEGPQRAIVLGRDGARYSAAVGNQAGYRWRAVVVLAQAPADAKMALELRTALHELRFGGDGWLALLPLQHRLPLLWEEAQRQPDSESVYREEATELTQRSAPLETFTVPSGYTKVDFDPQCMRGW